MKEKTFTIIGTLATLIMGWNEISAFLKGIFNGLDAFLKSIPPLIILGIIIGLFWKLGNQK